MRCPFLPSVVKRDFLLPGSLVVMASGFELEDVGSIPTPASTFLTPVRFP